MLLYCLVSKFFLHSFTSLLYFYFLTCACDITSYESHWVWWWLSLDPIKPPMEVRFWYIMDDKGDVCAICSWKFHHRVLNVNIGQHGHYYNGYIIHIVDIVTMWSQHKAIDCMQITESCEGHNKLKSITLGGCKAHTHTYTHTHSIVLCFFLCNSMLPHYTNVLMVILRKSGIMQKTYSLFILLLWGIRTITRFCIIYPIVELFIGRLIQGKEIWKCMFAYICPFYVPWSKVIHTGSFNDTT